MKIGLTYDLKSVYLKNGYTEDEVAEFDSEETITGIEQALKDIGFVSERIGNIKELTAALVSGKKWDLVFNICEGMFGQGREAQVPALLDAYQIPYTFSDPLVLALTLNKGMTKRVIRDCGIPTAPFLVIESLQDLTDFDMKFPVFVKPNSEGSGKGIGANSVADNFESLKSICAKVLHTYNQPVIIEKLLTGREFTVGILGTGKKAEAVGVMEILIKSDAEEQTYSSFIKQHYQGRVDYKLAEGEIEENCKTISLKAWKALGCRDAGRIDLKMDENGILNFIEVNPLPGINFIHSDLPILLYKKGWSYKQLIEAILHSASERMINKVSL